ncbi:type VI secretion system tube protein Hcp [Erwinia psidii]|uniref:Hcp family type VI secretion system effector n=1 Tax=Erwinia psidii TaxID=69224 RepID=UPI00226B56F2|nr:type VI secretion system tube protein Hcp [Erwinia psidii]MCX8959088.1 type VI secretion system tube protein Hcp [Erwinia psidii]MCX8967278.1 type VI secretion system tube protein Hcp [Erwinia psidii]
MNNVFLKIDGVSGESRDAAHSGWTDVDAYSWGSKRSSGRSGAGAKVNYHNLTVHCQVDKATAGALLYSSNGNKIKSVQLSACKAGGEQMEYYRITLENVIVVEVLFRDNGALTDVEYEFEADKVKFQYWEQGAIGGKGAETRMGWDIKNSTSYF